MSLATQLSRWITAFGIVFLAGLLMLSHHHRTQDWQRMLNVQANQILDMVFQYRAARPAEHGDDPGNPWCMTTRHFATGSHNAYLIRDISLHPLNPLNHPSPQERHILSSLAPSILENRAEGWVPIEGTDWYALARPIHYSSRCLGCHEGVRDAVALDTTKDAHQGSPPLSSPATLAATLVLLDPSTFSNADFFLSDAITLSLMGWVILASLFLWLLLRKLVLDPLASSRRAMERFTAAPEQGLASEGQVWDELASQHRMFEHLGRELKRAQLSLNAGLKELEEEENRFRALTQSATDAIISADEEGFITSWNRGAERLFGHQEAEILGKAVALLIPAKHLSAHLNGYASAVAAGVTRRREETFELQGLHKNGQILPVEAALSTWSIGGRRYFCAIMRDIGKRKRNAEKNHRDFMSRVAINNILEVALKPLTLNEKLTKSLQILLAVPWLALQYKGAIFLLNHKTGKLDMLVEHGLADPVKAECREIFMGQCLCGRAASTQQLIFASHVNEDHSFQFEGMSDHGHYCVPILLGDRLLGVINLYLQVGHARDVEEVRFLETIAQTLAGIIDRKMTERKLRYLSQALEQSPSSIVITDTQGLIEYVNPTCCRVSGYDTSELIGRNPKLFNSGEMPPSIYKTLWETILAGQVWHGELLNRRKNGELYWEDASISPIRVESGGIRFFLAVKEDISQRKHLEASLAELLGTLDIKVVERTRELNAKIDELEQTRNELVKSEKMASLGRLVAGFAHEINTPIGVAVTGFSLVGESLRSLERLLEQDEVREEELQVIIATIREASELAMANISRAGELVASFKRTSVDQSADIQRSFNVREVVMDVVRSLHNQLKKTNITIQVTIEPTLKVLSWPGTLEQILTNLIINSLTHGYKGESPAGTIVISSHRFDNRLFLDYSDDGCGMEESVRGLVFEPFFTTIRNQGGSGLGLYLCYNIVTSKLNGSISCESSPGHGTQFHISFPIPE
ncbi:MAG: PAS domain S-box protein [Magnetococcales bacterium]|nr:PAS domain S-box protein [Magnetococcales bacterium]